MVMMVTVIITLSLFIRLNSLISCLEYFGVLRPKLKRVGRRRAASFLSKFASFPRFRLVQTI